MPVAADYHASVIAMGIDPGTAATGFGVVALHGGRLRLVDAGCIRTLAGGATGRRLDDLHRSVSRLMGEHRPERVAIERLFFQRNVRTAMTVAEARGVVLLAAAQHLIPVDEPTPSEVKLAVCGHGGADKGQVAAMVSRLLGVAVAGVADDTTDALALAIGCVYRAATPGLAAG
jgi:crossover junction endodeoxyribonuclease RuvC